MAKWVLDQKKLLITDTTCRDAHQSLLATWSKNSGHRQVWREPAESWAMLSPWVLGAGATFDVAYRFLHESPWERLDLIREKAPNLLLQMLLRGANAVGYQLSGQRDPGVH